MRKNYRFEILSFLFHRTEPLADIRPFVNSLAKEGVFSELYFGILLEAMRANNLIWFDESDQQLQARIQPEGITEYHRLKLHCIFYSARADNNKPA